MLNKPRLLTPGPTPLPEQVRLALAQDMIHHRKAAFKDIMLRVQGKLRTLFGTEEQIIEYDFTAGSDADAKKALKLLEEKRQEATASEAETESAPPSQAEESTPAPQAASEP